jgi:DNA mismatch repair protein MutS
MSVTQEYFSLQEEYQNKYGNKTVVLYNKGSFYEIFTYNPFEDETRSDLMKKQIGLAKELSIELNIVLTKTDKKSPHTIYNPYMIGFPTISYEKHKDLLLSKGYTIVKVDQTGKDDGNRKERKVTEIISPGTNIESVNHFSNNTICIYIELQEKNKKSRYEENSIICGISCIDISTGKTRVLEVYSTVFDKSNPIKEINRFLIASNPKEIIIFVQNCLYEDYNEFLEKILQLDKYSYNIRINNLDPNYENINYQKQFLNKIYEKNNLNIFELLGIEKYKYGTISYILLLQFVYEHNEILIKNIQFPETNWLDQNVYLQLTNTAAEQLHLVNNKSLSKKKDKCFDSLFEVLDNTSTSLGKRYLLNMLMYPIIDVKQLNNLYDMIEYFVNNKPLLNKIESELKEIYDIERIHHKLELNEIKPFELCILIKSYDKIISIINNILETDSILKLLIKDNKINNLKKLNKYVKDVFKLDFLQNVAFENKIIQSNINILNGNVCNEADICEKEIIDNKNLLIQIVDHLNNFIVKGSIVIKEEDKSDFLITTETRSKQLKSASINKDLCGELYFEKTKKDCVYIKSEIIDSISNKSIDTKDKLNQILTESYFKVILNIKKYGQLFQYINNFVAQIDYIVSNSKNVIKYKYYKPEIIESDESFIESKDLRHPLVERIIKAEYISNDIELKNDKKGLLLYGLNSSGKTCLTKSIGLAIIMAQCGMWVAGRIRFSPYKKILTRLTGNDDMLRGYSSFAVEMIEINTILINSDEKSLVLGDELTRGTESASGTGLIISLIEYLIKRRSTFIVSSHMHHMPKHIKCNDKIHICHLSTIYDEKENCLIYNRKLKEGQGSNYYGIEVAKSFISLKDFIERANEIRKEVTDVNKLFLQMKKSRYNSNLYVDHCEMCGKQNDLHTHHVKEQKLADIDGFIDNHYKNKEFNLMILCEDCHEKLHKDKQKVNIKYVNGIEKIYEIENIK